MIYRRAQKRYYQARNDVFWRKFDKFYRSRGFDNLYFTLSFDCDRDVDAEAASALTQWLNNIGIVPTFAVPGAQLKRGKKHYETLLNHGALFINHGAAAHTKFVKNKFESVNFYDKISQSTVVEDILLGHDILFDTLGISAKGFRAPHFGSYELPRDLGLIYETIGKLGYNFSSTTTPINILNRSRLEKKFNLKEFPVTGEWNLPFKIMDSWEHCANKFINPRVTNSYIDAIMTTVSALKANEIVGHINIYCDPSHVVSSKYFQDAIECIISNSIKHVTYDDLVDF